MDSFPKILSDLERGVLFTRKEGVVHCVGSRESDRYIAVSEDECDTIFDALKLMDGVRSFDEVQRIVDERAAGNPSVNVRKLFEICDKACLTDARGDDRRKNRHSEIEVMLVDLKSFEIAGIESTMKAAARVLPAIVASMLIVMLMAVVFAVILGQGIPLSAMLGDPCILLYVWIVQIPSILLHECGHAVVAIRYGIRPKKLSLCVFYYCSLAFYIKIPGVYFKPPSIRLRIWSAGVFTNLFLAASFTLLYLFTTGQIQLFATAGIMVNIGMALSNIVPFFYSDGYYILSTLLKAPNLRKKSFFGIRALLKQGLCRGSLVYWLYITVTACFIIAFIGIQLAVVGGSILVDVLSGLPFTDMLQKYANIFLLISIGLAVRLVVSIKSKSKEVKADLPTMCDHQEPEGGDDRR